MVGSYFPYVSRICVAAHGRCVESNKVNTLDNLLKTLTPPPSLTWLGFATGQVKLFGRDSERLREGRVKGFGRRGESLRETT